MCVFCDRFRNRVRGYEELDNKVILAREVHVGVMKSRGSVYLMVTDEGAIESAIPIAYCPLCGGKIGGEENDKD